MPRERLNQYGEDRTRSRYSKTSLGTLPRPIGVVRASICVSVTPPPGGGVVLGAQPCPLHLTFSSVAVHRGSRRSMPVSRFLSSGRDGAWRSGASGSGFIRSDSTNRPWLRSWNGKKTSTDLNGLRDSEKAYRARVSIPERSSVYEILVARKDRSYQQRCSGRPLRFLRVAVTTARCSAIGVCYIISGVPKPYVSFFFAQPAYPHEKHRKIVFARLVFREMILYWLVPMTCETRYAPSVTASLIPIFLLLYFLLFPFSYSRKF